MTEKNEIARFLSAHPQITQINFAERIGVNQTMVSHFVKGRCKPSPAKALDIEREFGIDAALLSPVIAKARTQKPKQRRRLGKSARG